MKRKIKQKTKNKGACPLANYFSFIKFSHTIFAMPFAFIGFFLAVRVVGFEWTNLLLVIACMIFARNFAMSFNRLIDMKYDKANKRTNKRELITNVISKKAATVFLLINIILFFVACYFLNSLSFYLSPVVVFVLLFYSITKRFTSFSHLFLGLALSITPVASYIAVANEVALLPFFFAFVVLFWVAGFDIIYSLQDIDFDKKHNLKSIPAFVGKKKAKLIAIIFHLISIWLILFIAFSFDFSFLYWLASALFIIFIIYQHLIIRFRGMSAINLAFFTANGIASLVFGLLCCLSMFY